MKCKIRDAKTEILLPDNFRWVKCKLLEGKVSDLDNSIHVSNSVLVEYMRAYYIKDKVVEKLNQERFYYANQIRR